MMLKTTAAVLLALAVSTPVAAQGATGESTDGSLTISVEIPARTAAPTPLPTATPTPSATVAPTAAPSATATPASPAPAGSDPDADASRPGALPATGGEIALWAGALGAVALVAGIAIRAARRHRA